MQPTLFVNIGWMKHYLGPSKSDVFVPGNFGYFKTHQGAKGHEQWNFKPTDGYVYGYVPRSCGVNISRLGGHRADDAVEGVRVVFMARDPLRKKLKVVGWYTDATVHRRPVYTLRRGEIIVEAPIRARASDAYVLPVPDRDLPVPTARKTPGGVGQCPVWYAEGCEDFIRRLDRLISGDHAVPALKQRAGRAMNSDPESRAQVEQAAMKLAMAYYENAVDVSKDCKGWDIESRSGRRIAYIEVKGLSGKGVALELTPNEYAQMYRHRARYSLFVVTQALSNAPRVRIFKATKSDPRAKWSTDDGDVLTLFPMTGARGRL